MEEKRAFVAKDLFRHRVIASLEGAPTHDCLAFKLSRALRKEDSYERTLWGLRAGDGGPRPLTSVAFSASYPRWNSDASALALLSDRGRGTQLPRQSVPSGRTRARWSGDVGPQAVSDGTRLAEFVSPRSAVDAATARIAR